MARKDLIYKGTEKGMPIPFAEPEETMMVSRTGNYSSFNGSNSRNLVWAANSAANTDYVTRHILIHSIQYVNVADDNSRIVYFYQNDDETNANARAGTNLVFYLVAAGTSLDKASNVCHIDFPIPLCIKNGCRISASASGPIVSVNYTVLDSTKSEDYTDTLQYKFLTACSHSSNTSDVTQHANLGTITSDVELWGGIVFNTDTDEDDYAGGFVKNGAAELRSYIYANENRHDGSDASAAFTGVYRPVWYHFPVYLKEGLITDASNGDAYCTWFYRVTKKKGISHGIAGSPWV